jgi:HAD superfamily hydrolase (TIGR01493 family)
MFFRLFCLVSALFLVVPVDAQTDVIGQRKALMKAVGGATRDPGQMLRGQQPFDLAKVKASLDAYADAASALAALRSTGIKTAILSNGDAAMLERAVSSAHLGGMFDSLLSVETIRLYKTDPAAYRLVEQQMGISPEATAFVSSNRWDIAGANVAGFHCIWLNRLVRADEYPDMAPSAVIQSLGDLLTG